MAGPITVVTLTYYPIKSCAGISLDSAVLEARGIEHDREFMIIDASKQRFVTQREHPSLALVRVSVNNEELNVEAPGISKLSIPITKEGNTIDVRVWDDTCLAIDQGNKVAQWLGGYMQGDYRLVRMNEQFVRKVNPKYAKREQDQVGFADWGPLLLISEESLTDLNSRLKKSIPMNRFRPNIVISGSKPYFEDTVSRLKVGEVVLDVVKPCYRCVMTATDQNTANVSKEPLTTLAKYRKDHKGVTFGQNALHANTGTINLGDKVEVLEYKVS